MVSLASAFAPAFLSPTLPNLRPLPRNFHPPKCMQQTSTKPRIVVLPGMDGTDLLLHPFRQILSSPTDPRVQAISYPSGQTLTIPQLATHVHSQLPHSDPRGYILLAQSFSGHVAMHLAQTISPLAYVFVNAFPSPPTSSWIQFIKHVPSPFFRYQPPASLVAPIFLGDGPGMQTVQNAGASNLPHVMHNRLQISLSYNSWHIWRDRRVLPSEKILYLRGFSDAILTNDEAQMIRLARPDVKWVDIPNGPHLLLQRYGEQCAHVVEQFCDEILANRVL